jgi:hypothetical protein
VTGFPSNGPNEVDVSLVSDAGGLPGSTIESWQLTDLPSTTFPSSLVTISSVLDPILLPGTQYWVVATAGPDTYDVWTFTLAGSSFSPLAVDDTLNGVDSGWELNSSGRQGALAISGDAVPEPSTLALTALALLSLTVFRGRDRRRSGVQSLTWASELPEHRAGRGPSAVVFITSGHLSCGASGTFLPHAVSLPVRGPMQGPIFLVAWNQAEP